MAQYEYKLADGSTRWRYMTYIPDPDGRDGRKQLKKGGFVDQPTAKAAEEAIRAKFNKVKARAAKGTVAQRLMAWVDTRNDIEPTSVSDYRYRFNQYVIPYIGDLPLHRASDPNVIAALYSTLRDRGARPRTRAEKEAAANDPRWKKGLSEATAYAVHLSLMAALRDLGVDVSDIRSPRKRAKKGKGKRKQGRRGVWDIAQVTTFLASVKGKRTYLAWCLFAISGMRRGEVAGLRWSDIDLDAGLIQIDNQRTTLTGGHGIHEGEPKQGSSRPILVGPQVLELLRAQRDLWVIEQAMCATRRRADWKPHDIVFTNGGSGMPYYPGHFSHQFEILAERAGLPRIALHDVRHSVATNARPLSIDIKTMQAQLGHSDTSMLLDVYTHIPEYQAIRASLTVMESAVLQSSSSTLVDLSIEP